MTTNINQKLLLSIVAVVTILLTLVGCRPIADVNTISVYVYENGSLDIQFVNNVISTVSSQVEGMTIKTVNYDNAVTLQTEIMAGKSPDVLIMSGAEFSDYTKLMHADVLADLTEYFKNDDSFTKSNYYQAILDGGKYNNRQYIVPLYFSVPTTFITQQDREEYQINLSNGQAQTAFDILNCVEQSSFPIDEFPLFNFGRPFMLSTYLSYDIFADNEVNIDTEEFKNAIESFKPFYSNTKIKGVEDGLIFKSLYSSGQDQIHLMNRYNALTESIIPLKNNNYENVGLIECSVAVSSNCKDKDTAYQLVRELMDNVTAQQYNSISRVKMAENLNDIFELESFDGLDENDSTRMLIESKIDEYLSVVDNVGAVYFNDRRYDEVIKMFEPYFSGQTSLEDCIKLAEGQFEISLSE